MYTLNNSTGGCGSSNGSVLITARRELVVASYVEGVAGLGKEIEDLNKQQKRVDTSRTADWIYCTFLSNKALEAYNLNRLLTRDKTAESIVPFPRSREGLELRDVLLMEEEPRVAFEVKGQEVMLGFPGPPIAAYWRRQEKEDLALLIENSLKPNTWRSDNIPLFVLQNIAQEIYMFTIPQPSADDNAKSAVRLIGDHVLWLPRAA